MSFKLGSSLFLIGYKDLAHFIAKKDLYGIKLRNVTFYQETLDKIFREKVITSKKRPLLKTGLDLQCFFIITYLPFSALIYNFSFNSRIAIVPMTLF